MNSITELLDLEDADIFISDISISGTQKILTIETHQSTVFLHNQRNFQLRQQKTSQHKCNRYADY